MYKPKHESQSILDGDLIETSTESKIIGYKKNTISECIADILNKDSELIIFFKERFGLDSSSPLIKMFIGLIENIGGSSPETISLIKRFLYFLENSSANIHTKKKILYSIKSLDKSKINQLMEIFFELRNDFTKKVLNKKINSRRKFTEYHREKIEKEWKEVINEFR